MEKGEIVRNEQFLIFPQCFILNQIIVSRFVHFYSVSLFAAEFEEPKIGELGKGLTFSQTTKGSLFQTERICRQQSSI